MKNILLLSLFILSQVTSFSQGKLMLVGGGSEDYNSWSDIPYQWAVDNAANKKVAVISYSDETEWIPDYFISLGAAKASNIKIDSRDLADQQNTYDLLMEYDLFFFKGGDQSNYYKYFKGTKTAQATIDKYHGGGVISGTSAGMAILSDVIFTAERGSVYPDDALEDYTIRDITLADDLFPFLPGMIVDSHFTERGRIGRLLGFLANWYDSTGEILTGIGVDDRTALCIDSDLTASVYGTGSVSFYTPDSFSSFQDSSPVSDSIPAIQLLHGHRIDLTSLEILNGPENNLVAHPMQESGNYQVLLSGSDGVDDNISFMETFIHDMGNPEDTVLLISKPGGSTQYSMELEEMNVPVVLVETSQENNSSDAIILRNQIRSSRKILFAENDDNSLFNFLNDGSTGDLLSEHIHRNSIITGFIGNSSRYAGKTFVTNYLNDPYDAYYGDLVYKKGLGLLKTSFIMPNTFDEFDADFYENTTAAVMYSIVLDSVRYGIYLNRKSYINFHQQDSENYFQAVGDLSALILSNDDSQTEIASQPVNSSGDTRNYVAFSFMTYHLLNGTTLRVGEAIPSTDLPYEYEKVITSNEPVVRDSIRIYPNPASDNVTVSLPALHSEGHLDILNLTGQVVISEPLFSINKLNLSELPSGMYIIQIQRINSNLIRRTLIKK